MTPTSTRLNPQLWQCLWGAVNDLGWSTNATGAAPPLQTIGDDACWLRWLLTDEPRSLLAPRGISAIEALLDEGVSLRRSWRAWHASVERWLGVRLYLGHASGLAEHGRWMSIVSSRMGRHASQLPDWPQFIDSALRSGAKNKHRLLIAPRSAPSEILDDCVPSAQLPVSHLQLGTTNTVAPAVDVKKWLVERLGRSGAADLFRNQIDVSPAVQAADNKLEVYPLQDRAAIVLANVVYVLSIRRGGSIERLIEARLGDERFPAGSLFVATRAAQPPQSPAGQLWLERGAVGWYVRPSSLLSQSQRLVTGCRVRSGDATGVATQQLCGPLPQTWRTIDDDGWDWLAHCTRGKCGPAPGESENSFRQRAWTDGTPSPEPLWNLLQILQEGWLRGSAHLTRSANRCVCFSAVPLPRLLERRTYRSHLGRWDWEPYGLLVRRNALQQMGARPVVYGTQSEYEALDVERQAYFQPLGKSRKRDRSGWQVEREWRVLGDLNLFRLPRDSVVVFVRNPREAFPIARRHGWNVVWTGANPE